MANERKLDWASGGWIIAFTLVMMLAVIAWRIPHWRASEDGGAIGGGSEPTEYGFDLSNWDPSLDREYLVGSGQPKEGIPSWDAPTVIEPEQVLAFNEAHRGKYLVDDDIVIGVEIAGQSRAYPIRVLNWHEIINDTLGGRAIAVTYNPLCDSVVVVERTLSDGTVAEFGVSGLLYASNLLLYDRSADTYEESLWSQLLARSVAGPRRGETLELLPFSLTTWLQWKTQHPDTTAPKPSEELFKRYQRNPYGSYLLGGHTRYPVPVEIDTASWSTAAVLVGQHDALTWLELPRQLPGESEPSRRLSQSGVEIEMSYIGERATVRQGLESQGFEGQGMRIARKFAMLAHFPPN